MDFTGTSGDDTITGTSGDDLFKVFQGGNDTVSGLTGSDVFNFAATLTAADTIDGGGGQDTVQIKGDYATGILFSATTMVNVETLTVGAGFNYTITTDDATVAAGAVFTLNAAALAAPNYVVFNGSAETNGLLHFHGGAGDDTVGMGANMIADDHFDGGDGNDMLILGGVNTLTFKSVTIHNIETIELVPTFAGSLAFNSGNVLAGQTIEIDGSSVSGAGSYVINAHNLPGNAIFDGGPEIARVTTGSGTDTFNMGANFSRNDRLDGGTGSDTLNLNGAYNLTLASNTIAGIDQMNLAGGHTYHITSTSNLATDQTMTVNATGLTASDSLFLDFSSETLGSVIVDGGAAPAILKGGQQGDAFDFAVTSQGGLTASDQIDGQAGYDRLYLDGDYTGSHALTLTATTVTNVEEFDFNAGHSYSVTSADATVAAGQTLAVNAATLGASGALTFNGAAETDGQFAFTGGAGNDTLTGGALADTFDLTQGGSDIATGNAGNSTFNLGVAFDSGDRIAGQFGYTNTLILNGAYSLTVTSAMATDITNIDIQGNHTASFVWQGNNEFSIPFTVDASAATGSLSFDAIGTSGNMHFIGGALTTNIRGTFGNNIFDAGTGNDAFAGLSGNDTFNFGANFTATDSVNGAAGSDVLNLDGDYSAGVTCTSTTLISLAKIHFADGHDYKIVLDNSAVALGQTMIVDASALTAPHRVTFDGSAEFNGIFTFLDGNGNDVLTGGAGNDLFTMLKGGNDNVSGGAGDDVINFGSKFTVADKVDGGAGTDFLDLSGDYTGTRALIFTASSAVTVDEVELARGHSYTITTADAMTASGGFLSVDGGFLQVGEVLTFDGSAETTASQDIEGGQGNDTITTGGGDDRVLIGAGGTDVVHTNGGNDLIESLTNLNAADIVDGGAGNDALQLLTEATGPVVFGATTLSSIETITFSDIGAVSFVMNDGNVAAGQTLTLDATNSLDTGSVITFDGSAETDGSFIVLAGRANDVLTGGAGNDTLSGGTFGNDTYTGGNGADLLELGARSHADTIKYNAVSNSTSTGYDTIQNLDFGNDHIKVSGFTAVPTGIDTAVTTGALSTASFDSDLAFAVASGQLAAHHAVLFTANSGTLSGHTFLVVDENGTAGYQASADLVIDVTGATGTLTAASFS